VLMENQQRKFTIWAFFDALSKRRWTLIFAIFPVLLAPFLPIAISGLYTTSSTTMLQQISVTQLDFFNFVYSNASSGFNFSEAYYGTAEFADGGMAAIVPNMVLNLNLSYPQWTYEQYSISQIEIPPNIESAGATEGDQLFVVLPATYVDMNCSVMPSDQYQVVKGAKIGWTLLFQNLGPENCQFSTNVSTTYTFVNTTTPG